MSDRGIKGGAGERADVAPAGYEELLALVKARRTNSSLQEHSGAR